MSLGPRHGNYVQFRQYIEFAAGTIPAQLQQSAKKKKKKGGGEHTVQSALLTQEPHFMLRIAAHQAHHNGFFLPALESIHTAKFKTGIFLS